MTEKIYYVYLHKDPETKEIVYVGKGTGGRAWDITRNRTKCNPDHVIWCFDLQNKGYIPSDWVLILDKNLSETEAYKKEKEYLHTNGRLKFNRQSGELNNKAKLTDIQAREIYKLCKEKNRTHKEIAEGYKVSRTAVSMISSRKQWKAATACLV